MITTMAYNYTVPVLQKDGRRVNKTETRKLKNAAKKYRRSLKGK